MKHGHSKRGQWTPTYTTWRDMHHRVKDNKHYQHVSIHPSWTGENGFETFLADMGERPNGMTIERKDNSKGYEPGNCIWATMKAQAQNRSTTIHVTINGVTKNVGEWCKEMGISRGAYEGRRRRGMSIEDAILLPLL